jgi:hypothetical protein
MLYFIKYTVHYKQVRARLVRRFIWVEDLLCSNHNNLNWDFKSFFPPLASLREDKNI